MMAELLATCPRFRTAKREDVTTNALSSLASLAVLETDGFADYRLLDSGNGRKLERFGQVVVDRPEPQALWRPQRDPRSWADAHAIYTGQDDDESGKWRRDKAIPESWPIAVEGVKIVARLGGFLHLGLFPEQVPHWQ